MLTHVVSYRLTIVCSIAGPTCIRDCVEVPQGELTSILALPPSGLGLLATPDEIKSLDNAQAYRGSLSLNDKCYLKTVDLSPNSHGVPSVIKSQLEFTSTMVECAVNMWQVLNCALDRAPLGT